MPLCPDGHISSDSDYCSECGKAMGGAKPPAPISAAPPVAPSAPPAVSGEICPDCGTPRDAGARFCEVCRYDFAARASFNANSFAPPPPPPAPDEEPLVSRSQQAAGAPVVVPVPGALPVPVPVAVPVTAEPAAPAPPLPIVAPVEAPVTLPVTPAAAAPPPVQTLQPPLRLRITVDPGVSNESDPDHPAPVGAPDRVFHLDLDENTLGRQYEGKGVHPEIVIDDPGISRRHLKFYRERGSFKLLELGSSNGTELNGSPLEPGVVTEVTPGDSLALGLWTRIAVEAR